MLEEMEEDDVSTLPTFKDLTAEKQDNSSMKDSADDVEVTDKKIVEEMHANIDEMDGDKLEEKEVAAEENVDQKMDETTQDDVICGDNDDDDDYIEMDSDSENEVAESKSNDKESDALHQGRTLEDDDATKEKVSTETEDLGRTEKPFNGSEKRKLSHEVDEDQTVAKRSKVSDDSVTHDKEVHQQEAANELLENVDVSALLSFFFFIPAIYYVSFCFRYDLSSKVWMKPGSDGEI